MNFMSGRSGFYQEISAADDDSGEGGASAAIQREHMFDKVVTPSDVGKLNRLVIPKQHAEKYFPLDSSTNEKGLLLNFEDRNGKPWRFRYSYWNSSQSYVMTKGWSRFVKEKKLDAGDIVSFQRGIGEVAKDRLFIDWRRRPDAPDLPPSIPHHQFSFHRSLHPWSPLYHHQGYGPYNPYNCVVDGNPCLPGSIVYLRGAEAGVFTPNKGGWGAVEGEQMVLDSVPVVQRKAAPKRLRLFGVNMDCPISDSDECDSTTLSLPLHHHLPAAESSRPNSNSSYTPDDDYKGKGSMSLDLDI